MSDKTSRLNLLKAQQAQKEIVANGLFNAMSPASFGGNNIQANNGLVWGIYGGSNGSVIIANTTITLTDNTVNYIYFNKTTVAFEKSTSQFGDYPCYKITTANGVVTDWQDFRTGDPFGGGSSSKDPNYASNGTPSTTPIATNTDSIAIGSGSVSSGYNSLAINGGESTKQSSIAIGQNNKVYMNFGTVIGGNSNTISSGERSLIISGSDNNIQATSDYHSIICSQNCTITSSAYNFSTIIASNQSAINARYSCIINGIQSYIQADAEYSFLLGKNGNVTMPFTQQSAFGGQNRKQSTGLSVESSSTGDTSLIMGDNTSNVKKFIIQDNIAMNIKVTLLGLDSNYNAVKMTCETFLKRYSGSTVFIGESSTTSKNFTLVASDSVLSTVTARLSISGQELNVIVNGTSDSIRWSCIIDSQVVNR